MTQTHISSTELEMARRSAQQEGRSLQEWLERHTGLAATTLLETLGRSFAYPTLTATDIDALEPAFDLVPLIEATRRGILPLRQPDGKHCLVIDDPGAIDVLTWAENMIAQTGNWHLALSNDIKTYLARQEEHATALNSLSMHARGSESDSLALEDISLQSIDDTDSPAVRLVNSTLYDALKATASDIHLESLPSGGVLIRYRIDGVLNEAGSVSEPGLGEQIVSRLKVMSELDIAEHRVPQDGRFKARVRGRDIDFRISIMPSIFGEDAVIRILDKQLLGNQLQGLSLDRLGFDEKSALAIRRLAREPYGMLLVTGPTGSGKTTTLYAALSEINTGTDKIVTIEDPVEYQLPGVLQIPVNDRKGLTFARGLRSILRHDPDKIMVGEIRDPETAEIAIQSALTGHLVFTTVHANNVFDVIGRFLHMGIDPYSLVSALNGIMAQRLVRLLCPHCAVEEAPDPALAKASGLPDDLSGFRFRAARGCNQCRGSGYKGRKAIAEFLILNDELREAMLQRDSIRNVKEIASRNGTQLLREAAVACVRSGQTSLSEINRVTFIE